MTTQDAVRGNVKRKGTTAALVALTAASCLQVVDPTANSIAVVDAAVDLGMDGAQRAFAASVGTLALAAFILTTGSLGDRLGRRKVMLAGLVVAAIGGVITAIAPVTEIFILGRAITGIGIAAAFGLSFALIRAVSPDNIPKAVSFWLAGQTAAAIVLGVAVGALAGINWRVGYMLMPIVAVIAFVMCMRGLPEAKADHTGPFDFVGLSAIAVAMIGIIYGLSNGSSYGWGSTQVLVPLIVGLIAMAVFIWWEARTQYPAFPVKLFKDPELSGAVATGFSFNMWQAVITIMLSMLWQYVFLWGSLTVSLALMPSSIAMVIGAMVAGRMLARGVPTKVNFAIGHVLLIGTLLGFGFATDTTPYIVFLVLMVAGGFARMLNETTMGQYFVAKPPAELTGAMSSSKTAIGQLSFALGTALSNTFVFSIYGRGIAEAFQEADIQPEQQGTYTGIITTYISGGDMSQYDSATAEAVVNEATDSFVDAFDQTMFIFAGILTFFALVAAFFIMKAERMRRLGTLVDGPLTADGKPAALVAGTGSGPNPSDIDHNDGAPGPGSPSPHQEH
ncbi:MFS transporter [Demequina globuliformis]|uniref:MFS transporter n=1 Tax=Demequina globuliformis TaxID=676202 RepID=UPI0007839850|nr:MFS transporter [Demequina globuliformis]